MKGTTIKRDAVWWWKARGCWCGALTTWKDGQLAEEGPFTNPARMIEELHGEDGNFHADVWTHAGWWDK